MLLEKQLKHSFFNDKIIFLRQNDIFQQTMKFLKSEMSEIETDLETVPKNA